jgi:serpin B
MNRWTAEQTGGRITDIVPELPPMLASLMRLVLINAVYFRGDWTCPFDDAATRPSGSILFLGRVTRPEAAGAPVGSQR